MNSRTAAPACFAMARNPSALSKLTTGPRNVKSSASATPVMSPAWSVHAR
ncbi:hypothetical protein ACFOWZ_15005 [Lentzea rhizosphaerae]|uniref:Uncharacterized protein n=1 Tax=Lentzea rhizosphaerae TaxID=2041025 RepID=A0ABV8BU59_9PSEU